MGKYTHWIRKWVDTRAGKDALEKWKTCCTCRESKRNSSDLQPVTEFQLVTKDGDKVYLKKMRAMLSFWEVCADFQNLCVLASWTQEHSCYYEFVFCFTFFHPTTYKRFMH